MEDVPYSKWTLVSPTGVTLPLRVAVLARIEVAWPVVAEVGIATDVKTASAPTRFPTSSSRRPGPVALSGRQPGHRGCDRRRGQPDPLLRSAWTDRDRSATAELEGVGRVEPGRGHRAVQRGAGRCDREACPVVAVVLGPGVAGALAVVMKAPDRHWSYGRVRRHQPEPVVWPGLRPETGAVTGTGPNRSRRPAKAWKSSGCSATTRTGRSTSSRPPPGLTLPASVASLHDRRGLARRHGGPTSAAEIRARRFVVVV